MTNMNHSNWMTTYGPDRAWRGGEGLLPLGRVGYGEPQRSGAMTVVPVFREPARGRYAPPLSGLKLSRVKGYGNVELKNGSPDGVAIVPLHIGYIQDGAQNHALCSAGFIAAGQKRMFTDACCVQEAQGGYLEERDQWFFILPIFMRDAALRRKSTTNFGKLWDTISTTNRSLGLEAKGHLELLFNRHRAHLNQYRSRFERLDGQTGMVVFLNDAVAGVEIAPTPEYFEELWAPLLCFCYGPAAMKMENAGSSRTMARPVFGSTGVEGLRDDLRAHRRRVKRSLARAMAQTASERFEAEETERYLDLTLTTVTGKRYSGQYVTDNESVVYASICARP